MPTPLIAAVQDYPLLNVFLTMLYFFVWILWIFLIIRIFMDIMRSRDLSGWGKAGWTVLVILIPFIGILIYLIVRGSQMHERDAQQAQAQDDAFRSYVQQTTATTNTGADQLAQLARLHAEGVLTDEEFASEKAKILA